MRQRKLNARIREQVIQHKEQQSEAAYDQNLLTIKDHSKSGVAITGTDHPLKQNKELIRNETMNSLEQAMTAAGGTARVADISAMRPPSQSGESDSFSAFRSGLDDSQQMIQPKINYQLRSNIGQNMRNVNRPVSHIGVKPDMHKLTIASSERGKTLRTPNNLDKEPKGKPAYGTDVDSELD